MFRCIFSGALYYLVHTHEQKTKKKFFTTSFCCASGILALEVLCHLNIWFSALEEWRKRKMDRERQREMEKNRTVNASQAWHSFFLIGEWNRRRLFLILALYCIFSSNMIAIWKNKDWIMNWSLHWDTVIWTCIYINISAFTACSTNKRNLSSGWNIMSLHILTCWLIENDDHRWKKKKGHFHTACQNS